MGRTGLYPFYHNLGPWTGRGPVWLPTGAHRTSWREAQMRRRLPHPFGWRSGQDVGV